MPTGTYQVLVTEIDMAKCQLEPQLMERMGAFAQHFRRDWDSVWATGLILEGQRIIGIGTLGQVIETESRPIPKIFALWVDPEYRQLGLGLAILNALAQACLDHYGLAATVDAFTAAGMRLCDKAKAAGIRLAVVDFTD